MARLRAALFAFANAGNREFLRRFRRDQSGGYLVIAGLMMPVLVGFVGLGTDATLWLYKHRAMQSAADSGAFSAATAYINNTKTQAGLASQAKAVTGSYGFVDGANNVSVTVNWPYDARRGSVEVIVQQPQTPMFAALFLKDVVVRAHAVALGAPAIAGTGCVLALDSNAAGAITSQGSSNVVLDGCSLASNSNSSSALTIGGSAQIKALSVSVVGGISGSTSQIITPPGGITTGALATVDPYAGASFPPPPSNCQNYTKTTVLVPGDFYCGMSLNAGDDVNLLPGIYYLDSLTVNGGATLIGNGVTLVFIARNGTYQSNPLKIAGGAIVSLTAPISGPTAGIVIFGDRNMPTNTSFQFNGGSTQIFNGAIYVPKGRVTFSGGSGTSNACTQLVADTVTFTGNSNFKIGCSNGTQEIGSTPASVKLIQ